MTWTMTTDDGRSESIEAEVSVPTDRGALPPRIDGAPLTPTCPFDPATGAAIFLTVWVKALTDDAPTPFAARFMIGSANYAGNGTPPAPGDRRIRVFGNYASGVRCDQFSSSGDTGTGFGVAWPLAGRRGDVETARWVVVIADYYSAATPAGDADLLAALALGPISAPATKDSTDPAATYRKTTPGYLSLAGAPLP